MNQQYQILLLDDCGYIQNVHDEVFESLAEAQAWCDCQNVGLNHGHWEPIAVPFLSGIYDSSVNLYRIAMGLGQQKDG